jgi:hypothetical protein
MLPVASTLSNRMPPNPTRSLIEAARNPTHGNSFEIENASGRRYATRVVGTNCGPKKVLWFCARNCLRGVLNCDATCLSHGTEIGDWNFA